MVQRPFSKQFGTESEHNRSRRPWFKTNRQFQGRLAFYPSVVNQMSIKNPGDVVVKSKLATRSESGILGTLNPFHKKGPKSPSFFYNGNTISYFAKMPRCQIIMLKYFMNALFLWKQDSQFSTIIYTKRLSRNVKLCLKL